MWAAAVDWGLGARTAYAGIVECVEKKIAFDVIFLASSPTG